MSHESVFLWGHLVLLFEETEERGVGSTEKGGDGERFHLFVFCFNL